MKIITQTSADLNSNLKLVTRFLRNYQIGQLLKRCNAYKTKGFSVITVFEYLLSVVFTNRSVYMNYVTNYHCPEFSKDTIYRFMNSPQIHWQKFTTLLATRVTNQSIIRLTDKSRENVLIVDDTLFERNRSKNVELLSRVFDHVRHRYTKGFRLLTLGWSDGNTFIPVSGSLLSSSDDKNLLNRADDSLDKRSLAARRRSQSGCKATEVMLDLIRSALKSGISASYVLFDTWFCSPSSLIAVKKIGIDVIAMAKKTPKIHYLVDGEKKSVKAIYSACKKRRGRSRYLLSVDAAIQKDDITMPVRLVFVRNRNKRNDYLVLITTDLTLSEDEIIRNYGKRWAIEVFFKVCKSYLKLTKSFRGLSFDAQTAHVAIVFTRYTILSLENRFNLDVRSIGELFYWSCDELADITYQESYLLLIDLMLSVCQDILQLSEEKMIILLDQFLQHLPAMINNSLKPCA
ncbi:IS4 family transposase [Acetobacterium wieringae]|uniref:Transposase DDE domain protein n=1 Tax=Acetobacterium wieringae TaxID=52694 RepID=A0A1F2PM54_9FIRM|nr:transposase [Acetobacterium wieringae]OFV72483.1 transposase DDE domain protein [Acetobacterium wieringae]